MQIEVGKIKWFGGYNYKLDRYNTFGIVESLEEKGKEFKILKSHFDKEMYQEILSHTEEDSNYLKNIEILIFKEKSNIKYVKILSSSVLKDLSFEFKIKILGIVDSRNWIRYIKGFTNLEIKKILSENRFTEIFYKFVENENKFREFLSSKGLSIEKYLELKDSTYRLKVEKEFIEKFKKISSVQDKISFILENSENRNLLDETKKFIEIICIPDNFKKIIESIDKQNNYFKIYFFKYLLSEKTPVENQIYFFTLFLEKNISVSQLELSNEIENKLNKIIFMKKFTDNISINNLKLFLKESKKDEDNFNQKIEELLITVIKLELKKLEENERMFEKVDIWFEGEIIFNFESSNKIYDDLRKEILEKRDIQNPLKAIEKLKTYLIEEKKPFVKNYNICRKTNEHFFIPYTDIESDVISIKFFNTILSLFKNKKDYRYVAMLLFDYCNNNIKDSYNYCFDYCENNQNTFDKKFINTVCLLTGMKKRLNESSYTNILYFKSTIDLLVNQNERNFLCRNKVISLAKKIDSIITPSSISVTLEIVGISNYSSTNFYDNKKSKTTIKKGKIDVKEITREYIESSKFRNDLIKLIPAYNRAWDHVNKYSFYYNFFDSNYLYNEDFWETDGNKIKSIEDNIYDYDNNVE